MVNLDNVSYIEDSNGKKAVVLSIKAFEKIKLQLEELEDIKAYIAAKNKKEESFPIELVEKLMSGKESKIKLMRKYRGYSINSLAKISGISESDLSKIEDRNYEASLDIYKKLAKILDIDIHLIT